jgi:hypothetical protein
VVYCASHWFMSNSLSSEDKNPLSGPVMRNSLSSEDYHKPRISEQ